MNCSCVDLLAVDDVGRARTRSEGAFTKNRDGGQNEQEAEVRKQNPSEWPATNEILTSFR